MTIELNHDALILASEAVKYARNMIHASSTNPDLSENECAKLDNQINAMRNRFFAKQESLADLFLIPNDNTIRFIKRDTRSVKQFLIGNCAEYADLVMNYLRKNNISFAEYFYITDGDHAFVVINRNPGSDPNKPDTWGDKAIIIDAWSNDYYNVSEIYNRLHCYRQVALADKPNVIYPYTKENNLRVEYSIHNGNDNEYKKQLLREMQDKLEMIVSTMNQFSPNNAMRNQMNVLYRSAYEFRTSHLTHFDMERKCNKLVRQALKVLESFPEYQYNMIRTQLIKSVIQYVKNTSSTVVAEEFLDNIIKPKYYIGLHPKNVLDVAKSLKKSPS